MSYNPLMKQPNENYNFFNSVNATTLSSLGYCSFAEKERADYCASDITFLYCDGGSLGITLGNKSVTLSIGKGIFLKKASRYPIEILKNNTKIFFAVFSAEEILTAINYDSSIKISVFGKAVLSRMISATNIIYGENYVNFQTNMAEFIDLLSSPRKISENSDSERGQIVKNCLELLILDNIKPAYKSIKSGFGGDVYMFESEKITEKIISYLSMNLNRVVTLDEIADKLFFSKSYIKRAFKEQTGTSILKAHTEMKINEAKKRLAGGEKSAKIASKLGFSSPNHFSRVFKAQTGMTPTQYKNSLHF